MWKLNPVGDGGELHCLVAGGDWTVGRKSGAVLLHHDQSISRAHARLSVSLSASGQQNVSSTFTVTDTSKYGTFVNDERLAPNTPKVLQPGDQLTFGVFNSKFRVAFEALVVCSSCVDNERKASLAKDIQQLGGHLVNSWSQDCTYLVMPSVKVTIKTICALLCCRMIVKPEFFSELRKAAQQNQALPKAESFLPEIDEPTLDQKNVDLSSRAERKSLFSGKTFIFLNAKQLKRLSLAVGFGGGQAQLLEEGSLPVSLLESVQSCVVDVVMGSSQVLQAESVVQWIDSVTRLLRRKGRRLIAESEIGLATIYASTKLYCNPLAPMKPEAVDGKPSIPSATLSQSTAVNETVLPAVSQNITVYAPDTEPSPVVGRLDTSGPSMVHETPEKDQRLSLVSNKGAAVSDTSGIYTRTEVLVSSHDPPTAGTGAKNKRPVLAANDDNQPMQKHPPAPGNQTKSPQPRANSLTSYFQPLNKKRTREGEESSDQSEAKLAKREVKEQEEVQKSFRQPVVQHSDPWRQAPAPSTSGSSVSKPATRRDMDRLDRDLDLDHSTGPSVQEPVVGKRKEMAGMDPMEDESIEMDIDDLESIMSTPMEDVDEPEAPRNRTRAELASDIKQEEVSFVEAFRKANVSVTQEPKVEAKPKTAPVKSDPEGAKAVVRGENGEDLPRNLLVIEFKSLLMAKPQSPQTEHQQTSRKNFKKFRKVAVPGSSGLPNIIGGSDLVAHNRAKTFELGEWLRETEEDSHNEREEALRDDLFRYDPRASKRR